MSGRTEGQPPVVARALDLPGGSAGPAAVAPDDRSDRPLTDMSYRRSDLGLLFAGYLVLVTVWVMAGMVVTESPTVVDRDRSVAQWLVERRTPALDTWSLIGSWMAESVVKVVATALLAFLMWRAWKRWREPVMMVVPLVVEAAAFITVTHLVKRPRPDVGQLDTSPVGSSFPSGHVGAAAAYGAVVVIVYWHTRNRWARGTAVVVTAAIPVIVGLARMYRGMHYLSDVIAGLLLGVASVAVAWWFVDRAVRRAAHETAR
jgi:membrane-associated phospholipid phosphatase